MVNCFVPLCNHKSDRNDCTMFVFPRSPRKRRDWQKLIRRADKEPQHDSRVCSCHFEGGKRSEKPTVFPWNVNKRFSARSPEKRRRRSVIRQNIEDTQQPAENNNDRSMSACSSNENSVATASVRRNLSFDLGINDQFTADGLHVQQDEPQIFNGSDHTKQELPKEGQVNQEKTDLQCYISQLELENAELLSKVDEVTSRNIQLQSELEGTKKRVAAVEMENLRLRAELERSKQESAQPTKVSLFKQVCNKDAAVLHFTGLPNRQVFHALLSMFDNFEIQYYKKWRVTRLDKQNQLFLTLWKLRRNTSHVELASWFKIERTTVSNIFVSWVMALHHVLIKNLMASIPPREKNLLDLPECFRDFPNTRIIVDCTEVTTATPKLIENQCKMYSNYKSKITSKGLIGIAPNGVVTFVSSLYAGSTSDKNVVVNCGILNHLVPGDSIMADKGFNIGDILPDGVTLNIPPFKDTPQFTAQQINQTKSIARARIHVERAISRLKNFRILKYFPHYYASHASEIFQVCAALINFQTPLIKECVRTA